MTERDRESRLLGAARCLDGIGNLSQIIRRLRRPADVVQVGPIPSSELGKWKNMMKFKGVEVLDYDPIGEAINLYVSREDASCAQRVYDEEVAKGAADNSSYWDRE